MKERKIKQKEITHKTKKKKQQKKKKELKKEIKHKKERKNRKRIGTSHTASLTSRRASRGAAKTLVYLGTYISRACVAIKSLPGSRNITIHFSRGIPNNSRNL